MTSGYTIRQSHLITIDIISNSAGAISSLFAAAMILF
jgi:hypothetical protein